MTKEIKSIELIKMIGKGAFGEVYKAKDKKKNKEIAVKLEIKDRISQLKLEYGVYQKLEGTIVPQVYDYGLYLHKGNIVNCMTMELLGGSVEKMFNKCDRVFSIKTLFTLAKDCISRIEILHHYHLLHRDIKPDNFVFDKTYSILYLVDFGLCKQYRNPYTLIHNPYITGKNLTGTARYASVNTHAGIEQARRDDLECLGYMLIYFCKGRLPWQGVKAETRKEKYSKIFEIKKSTLLNDLCDGCPVEIYKFMKGVKSLEYLDYPDYYKFIKIFEDGLKSRSLPDDGIYEWNLIKDVTSNKMD